MKNEEIIKNFIEKDNYYYESKNSNLSCVDNKLYSYNTIIGQKIDNKIIINFNKFSNTTARHIHRLCQYANNNYYSIIFAPTSLNAKAFDPSIVLGKFNTLLYFYAYHFNRKKDRQTFIELYKNLILFAGIYPSCFYDNGANQTFYIEEIIQDHEPNFKKAVNLKKGVNND